MVKWCEIRGTNEYRWNPYRGIVFFYEGAFIVADWNDDGNSKKLTGLRALAEEQLNGVQLLGAVVAVCGGTFYGLHPPTNYFGLICELVIVGGGALTCLFVQFERIRRL